MDFSLPESSNFGIHFQAMRAKEARANSQQDLVIKGAEMVSLLGLESRNVRLSRSWKINER